MKLRIAIITAVQLHLVGLALLRGLSSEQPNVNTRSSVVTVQVLPSTQYSAASYDAPSKGDAGVSRKRTDPIAPSQNSLMVRKSSQERSSSAVEVIPFHEIDFATERLSKNQEHDPSLVIAHSETEANQHARDVVGVFTPCQQLKLPQSWLNAPGLFPRLYEVDFNFPVQSGASVFNVLALRPKTNPMKYADEAILRSFESCVNALGPESVRALKKYFDNDQSVTGEVFSFKIEFQTAHGGDIERKGI
jgi:hypothetical protein